MPAEAPGAPQAACGALAANRFNGFLDSLRTRSRCGGVPSPAFCSSSGPRVPIPPPSPLESSSPRRYKGGQQIIQLGQLHFVTWPSRVARMCSEKCPESAACDRSPGGQLPFQKLRSCPGREVGSTITSGAMAHVRLDAYLFQLAAAH